MPRRGGSACEFTSEGEGCQVRGWSYSDWEGEGRVEELWVCLRGFWGESGLMEMVLIVCRGELGTSGGFGSC